MRSSSTQAWVETEFASLDLGDRRRNERAKCAVRRLADRPGGSIPAMCATEAEVKATYRLLSNEAMEPDDLRAALYEATLCRVAEEPVLLVIQDTTCLDFSDHAGSSGLGPTGGGDGSLGHGMFVHSALAVSAEGVPLGLLHQQVWSRDPETVGVKRDRKQRALAEKESYRWVQTAAAVEARVPADKLLVQIADREGDIFEWFAAPRRAGSHLLIRACHQRRLQGEQEQLWTKVAQMPIADEYELLVRESPGHKVRRAHIELRYCPVTIRPPKRGVHDPALGPISLVAIEVREVNHPETVSSPIRWQLLTDLPTGSVTEALRCVCYYQQRWLIERWHFVLKSGVGIEHSQLRSAQRLERLLVLCCAVAWRLLWMTYSARVDGDQPCTVALSDVEWRVLHRYHMGNIPPPAQPPPLREAIRWLAMLGGFLGRKGDGEPGIKVLWSGLTRLQDIVIGFLLRAPDVGNA
jgi:hypothetical protein